MVHRTGGDVVAAVRLFPVDDVARLRLRWLTCSPCCDQKSYDFCACAYDAVRE